MTQAFPLQWPQGWPRTAPEYREEGRYRFKRSTRERGAMFWSMSEATSALFEEIRLLGGTGPILSSNVALRLDGLPRSGQRTPDDPGVAVYFTFDGEQVAMGRDAFMRPEENIRSLTLAIQGLRQMERHGGGTMLKRAFEGFTALPPPGATSEPAEKAWWVVLGVEPGATEAEIHTAYKARAREAGGASVELNAARDEAMKR